MPRHELITSDTNFGLFLLTRRFAAQQALGNTGFFGPQPADAFARAYLLVKTGTLPDDPFETTIAARRAALTVSAKNNSQELVGDIRVDHALSAVFLGQEKPSEPNGRIHEAGRVLTELEGLGLIEDMCKMLGSHTLNLAQRQRTA